MRWIVWIAVLSSLTACQSTRGGCPPLIPYSAAQQAQAAAEMRKIPNSQIARMIVDYGKMRDACRLEN